MAQDFDPHILATMTEEERASILEEQSPEEKAAIVAIDTGSENGPDDDDEGAAPAIADPAPVKPLSTPPHSLPAKAGQPHRFWNRLGA